MSSKKRKTYRITPKGIASLCLLEAGILQSCSDPRIDGFWTLFEMYMKQNGYTRDE